MARKRKRKCRRCLRGDHEVGLISWGGLCEDCATQAVTTNARAIASRQGPEYERWRHAQERWQAATVAARFMLDQLDAHDADSA